MNAQRQTVMCCVDARYYMANLPTRIHTHRHKTLPLLSLNVGLLTPQARARERSARLDSRSTVAIQRLLLANFSNGEIYNFS